MADNKCVSVSSLRTHYHLTEDCCDQQITEIHIDQISCSICRKWKLLVKYLGMNAIVVSDIDCKWINEAEKRHFFFSEWRNEKGKEATYTVLIGALLKIKCGNDAEYVCKLLQSPPSTHLLPTRTGNACASALI